MKKPIYPFSAALGRKRNIRRWCLMPNLRSENVHEHSMDVAEITDFLATMRNAVFGGNIDVGTAVRVALYHDAGEIFTGDVVTPVKHANPKISRCMKASEKIASEKIINMLPPEVRNIYRTNFFPTDPSIKELVKAADKLSGLTKCIAERKLGNEEFFDAEEEHHYWLKKHCAHMPEVQYFIDHCLPAYEMTLDRALKQMEGA
jgi:5'-deoxynucleotidase